MTDFFFCGTLCHLPLLRVVLGRDVAGEPAVLPDHAVHRVEGYPFAMLVPREGAGAAGLLVRGLSEDEVIRLDFYQGGLGFGPVERIVQAGTGATLAQVYGETSGQWRIGPVWDAEAWQRIHAAQVVATAADVMALRLRADPAMVRRRYRQMLVRGAGRLRAAQGGPATVRLAAGPDDVAVVASRQPYAQFFAVEEHDLSFRRFDGTQSPVVTRAVFISGDAVTVLPYDPLRDRVLLIEQFRAGPWGRGDPQPWCLEAIAGRIDAGETPEEAARREAAEEAGLALGALLPVAQYYPSPGAFNEYLYSYVALADLPEGVAGVFGVEDEAEDIRGHLVGFDDLMSLVASGEVANAPLILTALWLQRERARLRG